MQYDYPYLKLKVPPAIEPISLTEFKEYLKISLTDISQDNYLNTLIQSSRQAVENYLNISLITQTWSLKTSNYNDGEIELLKRPIQAILTVSFHYEDGDETLLIADDYELEEEYLIINNISCSADYLEVMYRTGYGDDAVSIPLIFKQAILEQAAASYDNHDLKANYQLLFPAAENLLRPYRRFHL